MINALKKSFGAAAGEVFSSFLYGLSMVQAPSAKITVQMPSIPGDFTPVIRFAVASDIHKMNDRLADMIDTCYRLADGDGRYQGLDALCFAGDFTDSGATEEMEATKAVFDAHIDYGKTALVNIMGNHEFSSDKLTARARYQLVFRVKPEVHTVIKGFHFIGVSNSPHSSYPPSVLRWTRQAVKAAEGDDASKPVFTFQHPHNLFTVYGSVNWGTTKTNALWRGHNRVVNFSGHSHYPMNDPRSVWQGSYTALGTGTLKYFELENELMAGCFPKRHEDAAQFYVVEVDERNRVAIRCYDLITNTFFGEDYFIDDVHKPSAYAYTYKNRMRYDKTPTFEPGTSIRVLKNRDSEYKVAFKQAKDTFIVHDYKIVIRDIKGKRIYSESFVSDYFLAKPDETFTCDLGNIGLKEGSRYIVTVTAANAYYKLSRDIKAGFIA